MLLKKLLRLRKIAHFGITQQYFMPAERSHAYITTNYVQKTKEIDFRLCNRYILQTKMVS